MSKISRKPTDIPDALKSINVKAVLRRRGVYLRQRQNIELKEAAKPMASVLIKKIKGKKVNRSILEVKEPQRYLSFTDEVVEVYKATQLHSVDVLEKHFDAAIKKFLINTVLAKALENLSSVVNSGKSFKTKSQVFSGDDKTYLKNQARIDLEPYLQNMAVIAGQQANDLIDDTDPYVPSEVLRKRIQGNVDKFTDSMVDTDQEHLSDLIVAGIDEGQGVPEIASAIKSDFTDYSAMQATRITRTEVLRSANQSSIDAFRQSGVVEGKQWVIAGADDECADYDGEIVMLDGDFYSGDNEFQDGDPPLHPNCRCIVVPVLSTDEGDSEKAALIKAQKEVLRTQIKELESLIDKRTKDFKELKAQLANEKADDQVYIKALERHLGVGDEPPSQT